jgi:putative FmdB family regulatory protein
MKLGFRASEKALMPIYEYVCDDCGAHYERVVFHQKARVTCPKCESGKHTIQPSVFAPPASGSKASGGGSPMSGSGGGGCCGGPCGCH